jgi:tRNA (uracil-5-)-methyltransferase TRM9
MADVQAAYDRIAEHFAATRQHPWPEVEAFCERVADGGADRDGTLGLDVGCANGRHVAPLAAVAERVVGVDASAPLCRLARERAADRDLPLALLQGDAAALPLADDSADVAVYVATLHHLRPRERRVASLDELARVLAPGAPALVSVWSVTHDRFDAEAAHDRTVDWTLPGGETVPRFYHVYDDAEFRADLGDSALAVDDVYLASGNHYAEVRGQRL